MARRATAGRKPDYWERLRTGTAHSTYNPAAEGYGSPEEWQSVFNVRMGFEEARGVKAKSGRRWGSDWEVINDVNGDAAGDPGYVNEQSMWAAVKSAFKRAAMKCNYNFDAQNRAEADIKRAEQDFMAVKAAYVMLEDIYRSQHRLN